MPQFILWAAVAVLGTDAGIFLATTVVGSIILAVGTVGLMIGGMQLMSALGPHRSNVWGQSQSVSFSPTDPRRVIIGTTATQGALVTFQTWGSNNEYIVLIIRVADHKCASLDAVYWQGTLITLGAGGAVSSCYQDGHDNLWVTFHDGDWNQTADSDLIANGGGRWTSNDRGRGVAYVKIKARSNEKAFPGGLSSLFQFTFVITGLACYDRRLDSSVGGSGSQRWNDQATWAVSHNAAVITENVLRGVRVEDTTASVGSRASDTFFGLDLTDSDLPFADNIAAMNDCDDAIGLKAGGTEPRYTAGGVIMGDSTVGQVLTDLLGAMAGDLLTGVGRWVMLPGVARSSVRSFVDSDRRLDYPLKFGNDTPLDTIVNAVYGRFSDPASMYTAQPLPPRTSTADEAEDGGRKALPLDLPYVTSQTQGQRIQEIARRKSRLQQTVDWGLPPENCDLEAGDWITWSSDRFGFSHSFAVAQMGIKTGPTDMLTVVASLKQTASSVFAWTPATDELDRSIPANLASADSTAVSVLSLTAAVTTITGSDGSVSPALTVTTAALTDATVIAIRLEYRAHGSPSAAPQTLTRDFAVNPATATGTQTYVLADGVVGGYTYDVRATAIVTPARDANWTAYVTTSATTAAPVSAVSVSAPWTGVTSKPANVAALAGSEAINNATVAVAGANRVQFSQFESGTAGWAIVAYGGTYGGVLTTASSGAYTDMVYDGTMTAAGQYNGIDGGAFPVTAGENLAIQARISDSGNTTTKFCLVFLDAGGAELTVPTVIPQGVGSGVTSGPGTPADYLFQGFWTVPSGATAAKIRWLVISVAAGATHATLSQPMVMGVSSGQTVYPAFAPGPNAQNGATAGATWGVNVSSIPARLTTAPVSASGSGAVGVSSATSTYKFATATMTIPAGVAGHYTVSVAFGPGGSPSHSGSGSPSQPVTVQIVEETTAHGSQNVLFAANDTISYSAVDVAYDVLTGQYNGYAASTLTGTVQISFYVAWRGSGAVTFGGYAGTIYVTWTPN